MPTCACGCGQAVTRITHTSNARGRVRGDFNLFVNGHARRRPRTSLYDIDAVTGCWNWKGRVSKDGYALGTMSAGTTGRQMIAHRLFYIEAYGSIPSGLVLDHLCSNRRCVNPAHLEPVTQKENIRRARAAMQEQSCQM